MLTILVPLLLATGWAAFSSPADDGAVTVSPDSGVAGNFGTWTVTHRVGEKGIAQGGGLRVELPDTWHAGDRNSANPLQATNPRGDYYVSARSSRTGVRLDTIVEGESKALLVKEARPSLDGRSERYVFVVRVRVADGRLNPGDTLAVVYGDTSAGSRGMRAAVISTTPEPILVAVDAAGSGTFTLHSDRPPIQSRSGPPARLLLSGPSDVVAGRQADLRIAVVAANSNPTPFHADVHFEIVHGSARLSDAARLDLTHGSGVVPFTALTPGTLRITASAHEGIFKAKANPIRVHEREPE